MHWYFITTRSTAVIEQAAFFHCSFPFRDEIDSLLVLIPPSFLNDISMSHLYSLMLWKCRQQVYPRYWHPLRVTCYSPEDFN